jgi:hypothetical protein
VGGKSVVVPRGGRISTMSRTAEPWNPGRAQTISIISASISPSTLRTPGRSGRNTLTWGGRQGCFGLMGAPRRAGGAPRSGRASHLLCVSSRAPRHRDRPPSHRRDRVTRNPQRVRAQAPPAPPEPEFVFPILTGHYTIVNSRSPRSSDAGFGPEPFVDVR